MSKKRIVGQTSALKDEGAKMSGGSKAWPRTASLSQLALPTPPPEKRLRLIVLDYDDTLAPSSWVASRVAKDAAVSPEDARLLRDVEDGIGSLLQAIEALGCAVVIITNADKEWVRYSSARYLPRIAEVLTKVHVVSARHFEHVYPNRSVCWKAAAFTHVAKAFFATAGDRGSSQKREIISVGDSNDERLAVRAAAAPLGAIPKAIKLVDSPKLLTVARQLQTVSHTLPFLVFSNHPVDVDVAAVLHYASGWLTRETPRRLGDKRNIQDLLDDDDQDDQNDKDDENAKKGRDDLLQRVWRDASWGVLSAIRLQSIAAAEKDEQQHQVQVLAASRPVVPRIVSDPTIPAAA